MRKRQLVGFSWENIPTEVVDIMNHLELKRSLILEMAWTLPIIFGEVLAASGDETRGVVLDVRDYTDLASDVRSLTIK